MGLMGAKKSIKRLIRAQLFKGEAPLVIASTGRAGSTMLFMAIRRGYVLQKIGVNAGGYLRKILEWLASDFCDRLDCIETIGSGVIKTHALWCDGLNKNAKFLFIHGDPLESALSVEQMTNRYGIEWFDEHLYHLESEPHELKDLYQTDVLNYEKQINSWGNANSESVLCVAYEDIWENIDQISKHVGFKVTLPEFRERAKKSEKENINAQLFERLRIERSRIFR